MCIGISEYIYMYLITYFIITSLYKIFNMNIAFLLIKFKNIKDYKPNF